MKYQRGQALVLVLLSLAVVLTLVLFILSRSVTDISVSSKNEEAARAFSAAEAGIEQALVIGSGSSQTVGNAQYLSTVTLYAAGANDFIYPLELSSGDTATTWFADHDGGTGAVICDATHPCFTGNTFQVCWGKPGSLGGSNGTPAIEVSVFYETTPGDAATVKIARATLDPDSSRANTNSFSSPDSGGCTLEGNSYEFQKTFQFSNLGIPIGSYNAAGGLQFARVRMLYNAGYSQTLATNVNFAGNSTLPSQGQNITSTGTAGSGDTASNRKINVFQSWPEAPSVFDGAIYSGTGLTK